MDQRLADSPWQQGMLRPGEITMWKSLFLAVGIFATLVGIELLFIDSAVIVPLTGGGSRTVAAPEWAPWLLISVGAVTILNLCTLPRGLIKE
jgi:hypothetical protein